MEVAHSLLSNVGEVYDDTYHVALLAIIVLLAVWVLNVILSAFDAGREVIEVSHIYGVCQDIIEGDAVDRFLWHLNFINSIHDDLIGKREMVVVFQVVGLFHKPILVT